LSRPKLRRIQHREGLSHSIKIPVDLSAMLIQESNQIVQRLRSNG
jgi:hypothetical protein